MNVTPSNIAKPKLLVPSFIREIVSTLIFIIAVTVIFDLTIPRSLVDGQSMEPTLHDNDRLVINRVNYLFDKPQRGDVIVMNAVMPRDAAKGIMLIKRIIGLPGETVEMRDQQVYINGVILDEPYINEPCSFGNCRDAQWELGDDEFFVMGDNRNHSNDSRRFNAVPFNHIVGQAIFRYWPPMDIGIITD